MGGRGGACKRGRGDLLGGVGTEWELSRGQPARRSLRVGRLKEAARVERKARGTPQGQKNPAQEGPGRGKNRVVTTVGASRAGRRLSSSSCGEGRHGVPARAKEGTGPKEGVPEEGRRGLGRAPGRLGDGAGALTGTGASGSAS